MNAAILRSLVRPKYDRGGMGAFYHREILVHNIVTVKDIDPFVRNEIRQYLDCLIVSQNSDIFYRAFLVIFQVVSSGLLIRITHFSRQQLDIHLVYTCYISLVYSPKGRYDTCHV